MSETTDQQERYEAIDRHLSKVQLPYTVRFGFQSRGIKVQGQEYPLLKMEWVKGVSLSSFVASNLSNSAALRALADKWMQMLKALHQAEISHGDLQHGNVLIVGGDLRLIDYDGMYVPELNGRFSNEVGHRNYQHPHRTNFDYGPSVDNFSGWAIYATLMALSDQPELWRRHNGGDECLLFRRTDFDRPHSSAVFRELSQSTNANVRVLGEFLARLSTLSIWDVPDLDVKYEASGASAPAAQEAPGADGWWTDHLSQTVTVEKDAVYGREDMADVKWIVEGLAATEPLIRAKFLGSFRGVRILIGTSCAAILVTGFGIDLPAFAFLELGMGIFGLLTLYAFTQYRRDPVLTEFKAFQNALRDLDEEVGKMRAERKKLDDARNSVLERMNAAQVEWTRLRREIDADLQQEVEDLQARFNSVLRTFDDKRQTIADREGTELKSVQAPSTDKIAGLDRQISGLARKITEDKERTLRSVREAHVKMALLHYRIKDSSIEGIGDRYVAKLASYGYFTAADLERGGFGSIPGIGPKRLSGLCNWRDFLKAQAAATAPAFLPQSDVARIENGIAAERTKLIAERKTLEEQLHAGVASVRSKYVGDRASLEKEARSHRETRAQNEAAMRQRYSNQAVQLDKRVREQRAADQAIGLELTEKLREFDKGFGVLQWRWAKKEREGRVYKGLTFWDFLRRVISL